MRDVLLLLTFFTGAFVVSALLAHFLVGRRSKRVPLPFDGATLRLRGVGGMYRAKLLAIDEIGWKISCPLSRNNYVPLRLEDKVTVEAPCSGGVIIFRTDVVGRDDEEHFLVLAAPDRPTVTDRRSTSRRTMTGVAIIEDTPGQLVDISPFGARLYTDRVCHVGERLRIQLPQALIYAWVLDFWPTRLGEPYREAIRVRFEESVDF
jgi:hypothetical protein